MERPPTEATAGQKRKDRPVAVVDLKVADGAQEKESTTPGKRARRGCGDVGEEGPGEPGGVVARRGLLESLDPDTGLCVLSFLDTEDLVRQRAVSRRWGDLASADCLWKPRFLRLYGPPFLNGSNSSRVVCRACRVRLKAAHVGGRDDVAGKEGSWFGRYAEASRGMPRMPRDQEMRFPDELVDWERRWELDRDEDDGSEFEIKDARFSVVALPHLRRSEVGLHHHRLALHLAFLHT